MRYGIFSDVHSNGEALEAVLSAMTRDAVDQMLCAGDVVGYGPDPAACIDQLQKRKIPTVAGNHDWAVAGKLAVEWFHPQAAAAVEWTRTVLSVSHRQFLADLPLIWSDGRVTLVHSSLEESETFPYILDAAAAARSLRLQKTPAVFIGHTHRPAVYRQGQAAAEKILVNVGSVGQPRDGDPQAAYCLYDSQKRTVEFQRVPYPIEKVQKRMRQAGLPEFLIRRLEIGC